MKATTRLAGDVGHGGSLEQIKARFALWRKGRRRGERISSALWALAVGLVAQHGLEQTAQALRVDGEQLKKRVAKNAGLTRAASADPKFIELFVRKVVSDPSYASYASYAVYMCHRY